MYHTFMLLFASVLILQSNVGRSISIQKGCRAFYRRGCEGYPISREPFDISYYGANPVGLEMKCCCIELIGFCPRMSDPVCGTDGKTYSNKCTLCAAKGQRRYALDRWSPLKIRHRGEC